MQEKRYPKNHFLGIGIAIGIPLGMPIGLALGNIALGPAIGTAIGVAIGVMLEKKKNPNPRPLTEEERNTIRRNLIIIAMISGLVALIVALTYFLI